MKKFAKNEKKKQNKYSHKMKTNFENSIEFDICCVVKN